jgi:hypothetical protein
MERSFTNGRSVACMYVTSDDLIFHNTTRQLKAQRLHSISSQFTRADALPLRPIKQELLSSYYTARLSHLGTLTDQWPIKVLMADLIVNWGANPLQ